VNFNDILGQDLKDLTLTSFTSVPPTTFTNSPDEAFGSLYNIITVCDFSKNKKIYLQMLGIQIKISYNTKPILTVVLKFKRKQNWWIHYHNNKI